MLSNTCKSAIRAVVFLSSISENNTRSTIKDIARSIEVSEHTLGKLLQILVKKNIICSEKGPNGGFYINNVQFELPIMEIIVAIDGESIFTECGLGLARCDSTKPCSIHNQYKEARDLLKAIFNNNKIADLGDSVNKGLTYFIN